MTTGASKDRAAEFGRRLRARMLDRGMASATSRSGVDVAALAKAAGCSYEMARRRGLGALFALAFVAGMCLALLAR